MDFNFDPFISLLVLFSTLSSRYGLRLSHRMALFAAGSIGDSRIDGEAEIGGDL